MIIIIALAMLAESYIPFSAKGRRGALDILRAVSEQAGSGAHVRTYGSNAGESYCLGCHWEGPYEEFDAHIPDDVQ